MAKKEVKKDEKKESPEKDLFGVTKEQDHVFNVLHIRLTEIKSAISDAKIAIEKWQNKLKEYATNEEGVTKAINTVKKQIEEMKKEKNPHRTHIVHPEEKK